MTEEPASRAAAGITSQASVPIHLDPMSAKPLVSVLVSNYNYGKFLGLAIDSVLRQRYQFFELIVCDDGSTDDSGSVVSAYTRRDPRVTLIRKENGGQPSALNAAFARATGEVICLLDSDDIFDPNKISRVVQTFAGDPLSGLVAHSLRMVDRKGRPLRTLTYHREGYLGQECHKLSVGNPLPPTSGLSFRRAVLEEIFPLPDHLRVDADGVISGIAAYLTTTRIIPEVLAEWRIHGNNDRGMGFAHGFASEGLTPEWLEGRIRAAEPTLAYVEDFLSKRTGCDHKFWAYRPMLEWQLARSILQGDQENARAMRLTLEKAYECEREDYPLYRLLFWKLLTRLPADLGRMALVLPSRLRIIGAALQAQISRRS